MRRLIATVIFCSAASAFLLSAQPAPSPAMLAAVREALGGGDALDRVTTFSVTGTDRLGTAKTTSALDVKCVLPDRFVRIRRRSVDQGRATVTDTDGFNGQEPIHQVVPRSVGAPSIKTLPSPMRAPTDDMRAQRALMNKRRFVEFALPLFATSFAVYPLEFTDGGEAALATGRARVIDVKGADGFAWSLFVDPAIHLPVQLTWRAKPVIVIVPSLQTAAGGGQLTRQRIILPSPRDPAGEVEWRIEISSYKRQGELMWPHRLTTFVDGRRFEDLELGEFRINEAIDSTVFEPRWSGRLEGVPQTAFAESGGARTMRWETP
jgi:hypothetical protein